MSGLDRGTLDDEELFVGSDPTELSASDSLDDARILAESILEKTQDVH